MEGEVLQEPLGLGTCPRPAVTFTMGQARHAGFLPGFTRVSLDVFSFLWSGPNTPRHQKRGVGRHPPYLPYGLFMRPTGTSWRRL